MHVYIEPSFHHGISWIDAFFVDEEIFDFHSVVLFEPGISINPIEHMDITIHGGVGVVSTVYDLGDTDNDGILTSDFGFAWKVGITIGGKW